MTNCRELFATLGVVFPNHVRAIVSEGRLEGISGKFNPQTLQTLGNFIEAACPDHASFQVQEARDHRISCRKTLVWTANRSNFLVRYVHIDHGPGACQVLATTTGPTDTIDELTLAQEEPMPLTEKEAEVALSIAAGKTVHQIAQDTDHSIHTIRNQLKSALRSTGSHSQLQLALMVRNWLF